MSERSAEKDAGRCLIHGTGCGSRCEGRKTGLGILSEKKRARPAWWPTAEQKRHADAGCRHPDECRVTPPTETGADR